MISEDVSYIGQRFLPLIFHLFCSVLASLVKELPKVSVLFPHLGRIQTVENGNHDLAQLFFAPHDLQQFIQTPAWRCVVFGEQDHCNPRFSNRLHKLGPDGLASLHLVVFESKYHFPFQLLEKVAEEVLTDIFSAEAREDIVLPIARRGGWRRWRSHREIGKVGNSEAALEQDYRERERRFYWSF